MEILGIGIPELGLILVIIFLVMGPKDMVNTARRIARTIRAFSRSELWRTTIDTWRMAKDIPTELLRESGLEEARTELVKMSQDLDQWKKEVDSPAQPSENHILPADSQTAGQPVEAAVAQQDSPGESPDPVTTEENQSGADTASSIHTNQ
jgi:Sec-independent protein translocase protein TatA